MTDLLDNINEQTRLLAVETGRRMLLNEIVAAEGGEAWVKWKEERDNEQNTEIQSVG